MSVKVRVSVIVAALVAICGLEFLVIRPSADPARLRSLPLITAAWILFAAAAWMVRKLPVRWSVALIVIGGIAIQLVAMSVSPQQSDDLYRYIWDGRVQAHGIDPYAYVPTAPQISYLRTPFLFPHHALHCVGPGVPEPGYPGHTLAPGCTRINRPTVPTIYPPVAEAYFLALHYVTPVNTTLPVQAAAGGFAVLVTLILLFGLRTIGRNLRLAALWAWCPTVALEAGNSAHVDVVAVALTAAALLILARRGTSRRGAIGGGVLLGLAIATKVTPVLVAPSVLKRRWRAVVIATVSAVVVVYVPHVLAVGGKVLGFLPAYLQQNGYGNGSRFAVIGLFVPGKLATVVAVLVLAAVGLAVLRFSDPDQPWRSAVVMTGAALAVTTPLYQWYAILLVMLVVLDGRPEWLAFPAGGYLAAEPVMGRYTVPNATAAGYGLAVLVVAGVWLARRAAARRARPVASVTPASAAPPEAAEPATSPATLTGNPVLAGSPVVLAAEEQAINAPALHSIIPAPARK